MYKKTNDLKSHNKLQVELKLLKSRFQIKYNSSYDLNWTLIVSNYYIRSLIKNQDVPRTHSPSRHSKTRYIKI